MITIRELTEKDIFDLLKLMREINNTIINKTWWLPVGPDEEKILFDTSKCIFYGAFDDKKLIGASALFLNEKDFKHISTYVKNIENKKVGKISRCMVMKDYRGNNLMYQLNLKLVDLAKQLHYDSLIVILHPDNIASKKSLTKLGMKKEAEFVKDNVYPREILKLELK